MIEHVFSRRHLLCACGAWAASVAIPALASETMQVSCFNGSGQRIRVRVQPNPKRLIVNDYACLDMLQSWDLDDRIVAAADPKALFYLHALRSGEVLRGGLKSADLKAYDRFDADLIFISSRLGRQFDEISKIAPTLILAPVYVYGAQKSYEDNLLSMASLFDKTEKAQAEIERTRRRIGRIRGKSAGKRAAVLMVNNGRLMSLPPKGRCSLITDEMGFESVERPRTSPQKKGSGKPAPSPQEIRLANEQIVERIRKADPDHIFVLNKDLAVGRENPIQFPEAAGKFWGEINAVKKGCVTELTHCAWYLGEGGVKAMDLMLADIEKALNLRK